MSFNVKELLNKWEFYAVIAGFVFSLSILTRKYLFNLNYKFEEVFLIIIITLAVIYTIYAIWVYKNNKTLFKYDNRSLLKLISIIDALYAGLGTN